jgi:hypothetical protein
MRPTLDSRLVLTFSLCISAVLGAPVLAADGDQDPTFGLAGVHGPDTGYLVRAATRLPNQYLAVVGPLDTGDDARVDWARMSSDGIATWDCGALVPLVATFEGRAAAVDRNGNLLVGGTVTTAGSTKERALIARFAAADPCDTLDTSWSDSGFELLDGNSHCDIEDCSLVGIAEAPSPSSHLFVLVESKVDSSVSRYFVVAFQSSGAINPLFGVDGWAEVAASGLGTLSSRGARLAADSAGRPLVLATRHHPGVPSDLDPVIVRFTTGGVIDTTFPTGGFRVISNDATTDQEGTGLVIAADGAVYVAVNSLAADHTGSLYGGMPEAGWPGSGTGGRPIAALALQGDGKILTVANATDGDVFVVSRFVRTATGWDTDWSFGSLPGHELYDVDLGGADGQRVVAIVLSEGRPIVLGNADTDTGDELFAIRLRNRYLFADGFESGSRVFWSAAR